MATFITTEDLKLNTQISNNVDIELLEPHLAISDDMYIRPILGDALTDELLTQIEENTISGNNLTLWINYIKPTASFYTWFSATPFLAFKTTRAGIVRQTTDNSESTSMEEFSHYSKRIEQTAAFYAKRLETYLDDNYASFPNYRKDCTTRSGRGSGIYLNYQ